MNEKYTPEVVKVNDSENAWLTEHGHLQMDGASYIKGMDDYEWYFATHKDYFPILGGSTVMLRSIHLLRMLGFPKFEIFCKSQEPPIFKKIMSNS